MDVLQMTVQGSAMILAVIVARALWLNRLPKAVFMVLWAVVMVRLLVPFDIALPTSVWSFAPRAALEQLGPVEGATDPSGGGLAGAGAAATLPAAGTGAPGGSVATAAGPGTDASQPGVAASTAPGTAAGAGASAAGDGSARPEGPGVVARFASWARAVDLPLYVWAVGCVALALFLVAQYARGLREFSHAEVLVDPYADQWLRNHPTRRPLSIREHGRLLSPMTYGLLHPVILVPKSFDWNDRGRASYMLMHEWVHVTRWDVLYKFALVAALCVHWFNPLVWAMYFIANRDIELACDERVVALLGPGARKLYAHTLLDMAEKGGAFAPLVSGFGKSAIEERIVAIVHVRRMSAAALAASFVLVVGISAAFATSAMEEAAGRLDALPVVAAAEARAYEAYVVDGYGASQVVTPFYAVFLEDRLFPNGFRYDYDEGGLGFYDDGTTRACSVLTVYDAATGAEAYRFYLASERDGAVPFAGSYAAAAPLGTPGVTNNLYLHVARAYDSVVADGTAAHEEALAMARHVSLGENCLVLHDDQAASTSVKMGPYQLEVPDALLGDGWYCVCTDFLLDGQTNGSTLFDLQFYEVGMQEPSFGVCAVQDGSPLGVDRVWWIAGSMDAYSAAWADWSVAVYAPHDNRAGEDADLLDRPFALAQLLEIGPCDVVHPDAFWVDEGEGLRLVTPAYTAWLPNEYMGGGWAWSYAAGDPDGCSHVAQVALLQADGGAEGFDAYCAGPHADLGASAARLQTGVASSDGLPVVVEAAGEEADGDLAKRYAALLQPVPATGVWEQVDKWPFAVPGGVGDGLAAAVL